MHVICFHSPGEPNDFLSNWFYSDFVVDGVHFTSGEQYMMYSKAKLFGDFQIADRILETHDFRTIKSLGRRVRGFNDKTWNEFKRSIMTRGLYEKFAQNSELAAKLLATGDALLAECAVKDCVWGIGLSMHDPARFNLDYWRGENLLGFILMDVRDRLRQEGVGQ